jgi:hypothetical protein
VAKKIEFPTISFIGCYLYPDPGVDKVKSVKKTLGFPNQGERYGAKYENGVAYLLSYTVSVEKMWTQNTCIIHISRKRMLISHASDTAHVVLNTGTRIPDPPFFLIWSLSRLWYGSLSGSISGEMASHKIFEKNITRKL